MKWTIGVGRGAKSWGIPALQWNSVLSGMLALQLHHLIIDTQIVKEF